MTNTEASDETTWVIVIRDPDESNWFEIYPKTAPVKVIDIDLGYQDLDDPEEASEWCLGHLSCLPNYPAHVAERVAWQVWGIIERAELDVDELLTTLAGPNYQTALTDEQITILRNTREPLA